MNLEDRIEIFGKILVNHRIKVILGSLLIIFTISFGGNSKTPSGYRGFVEEDFKYYKDVLDLEEKYGNIDVLTFVVNQKRVTYFKKMY